VVVTPVAAVQVHIVKPQVLAVQAAEVMVPLGVQMVMLEPSIQVAEAAALVVTEHFLAEQVALGL
jgi:hypothetical protein